jgi:hypothetical protein
MFGTTPRRRLLIALAIWAAGTAIFALATPPGRLTQHTSANHFALLAESLLHGHLDLPGGAPAYAGNNDFAQYAGKTWIIFPPFPAVLMLPGVALSGSAERFRDGVFFVWLAGLGPALFFLALERLTDAGLSLRSERENIGLAGLLGLGTVYFFTAVQGTVWFGAHVVAVALAALYLLASIEASSPILAGIALSLGFCTRTPLAYAFPFFVYEAMRVTRASSAGHSLEAERLAFAPGEERKGLLRKLGLFAIPGALMLVITLAYNYARFGEPLEFGYRYLAIVWQTRIEKWGLFSYHYLARNLGVVLSSLPFTAPHGPLASTLAPNAPESAAAFQISPHGLALWLTTPAYLALVRATPGLDRGLFRALLLTALFVALPSLFYQNTGQLQFGYRFSNDFAVFLLAALAVSSRELTSRFWAVAAVGVAVNAFGAATFAHPRFERFYASHHHPGGSIHQPD